MDLLHGRVCGTTSTDLSHGRRWARGLPGWWVGSGEHGGVLAPRDGEHVVNHKSHLRRRPGLRHGGALVLAWNAFVKGRAATVGQLTPGAEFPEVL